MASMTNYLYKLTPTILSLVIMTPALAMPSKQVCSNLIALANKGAALPTAFYQKNLSNINACTQQCQSNYKNSNVIICQSSLNTLQFNARLMLSNNKPEIQQARKTTEITAPHHTEKKVMKQKSSNSNPDQKNKSTTKNSIASIRWY